MGYVNSVIIQGNLVRDPELRQLASGTTVANFSVAVNHSYAKRDGSWQSEVSYLDCQTWAAEAKRCEELLHKGCCVKVIGRLKQERWQDKEGRSHSKIKIVVEYFDKLEQQKKHQDAKEAAAQTEAMHQSSRPTQTAAAGAG